MQYAEAKAEIERRLPFDQYYQELFPDAYNGRGESARCFSHDDKNSSFLVKNDHGTCLAGCTNSNGGKRFSIFDLWMHEKGHSDFVGAVIELGSRVGINVLLSGKKGAEGEDKGELLSTYERVWREAKANEDAALTFLEEKRGIPADRLRGKGIVGAFGFGREPETVSMAELEKGGLIFGNSGQFIGMGCLVFPITHNNQVANFYFRSLKQRGREIVAHRKPYRTDPAQHPALWNLDRCKKAKHSEVYLCEGIIKGVALLSRGRENVIAVNGVVGLTHENVDLLRQGTIKKVVVCFDSDPTKPEENKGRGQRGAREAAKKLLAAGLQVEIVELPMMTNEAGNQIKTDLDDWLRDRDIADFDALERREAFTLLCSEIPTDRPIAEQEAAVTDLLNLIAEMDSVLREPSLLKQLRQAAPSFTIDSLRSALGEIQRKKPSTLPTGKHFLPDPYADHLLKEHHIVTGGDELMVYEAGTYRRKHDLEVKQIIMKLGKGQLRQLQINEILGSIRTKTYRNPEGFNPKELLNLKNGILDLGTMGELIPHDPDIVFTYQSSTEFDPNATCPLWDTTLQEIFPDEGMRLLFTQCAGSLLIPAAKHHKGQFWIGRGANGKGVCQEVFEGVLGHRNCSALSLVDLSHNFRLSQIRDKLVNFSSEVKTKILIDDEIVKKVISGDSITVERKYKEPETIKSTCKLVIACNEFPTVLDKTDGFFRRWVVVPFDQQFEENPDPDRAKRILDGERSGVLNWMITGLILLQEAGGFTIPQESRDLLAQYRCDTDPVIEFAEDRLRVEKGCAGGESLQTLFNDYRSWMSAANLAPLGRNKFRSAVERVTRVKMVKGKGRFFPGIWLNA